MMTIIKALIIGLMAFCTSCAQTTTLKLNENVAVRTTAYTHTEQDHTKYGRHAAIGTQLKSDMQYNSAASDWSFLPVGTTFRISGDPTLYVIDDYGSALAGTKTIDIYRPSRNSMNEWGTKQVEIAVVSMGDYKRSLAMLQTTRQLPHISKMITELNNL